MPLTAATRSGAQATINDMTVGRSVEETLRLLDAYQFTDECGDVCPVNGRPGESGISPTSPRALALP